MSVEMRYRRIMRILPKSWRETNGEDLVTVFLEQTHTTGRSRLNCGDLWDIVKLSTIVRIREIPAVLHEELAASARLAGSLGLAFLGAVSVAVSIRLWVVGQGLSYQAVPLSDQVTSTVLLALWPVALITRSLRPRLGPLLVSVAAIAGLLGWTARALRDNAIPPLSQIALLFGLVLVVTLCPTPDRQPLRWVFISAALSVPFALLLTSNVDLYALRSGAILYVMAAAVVSLPICLLKPRLLFTAAILATPLVAAGAASAIDLLTTFDDPRPGPAVLDIFPTAIQSALLLSAPAGFLILLSLGILRKAARQPK